MKSKLLIYTLIFISLLHSELLGFRYSPSSCPTVEFYSHRPLFRIPNEESYSISSAFPWDLNKDGRADFVITTLPHNKKEKSPLFIFVSQADHSYSRATVQNASELFHARHVNFFDFNKDGYDEILVADHGPDEEPFPGASSFIIENKNGNVFKSHRINEPNAFTFHISGIELDETLYAFLSNIGDHHKPSSRLLKVALNAHNLTTEDVSYLIPEDVKNNCYMTNIVFDSEASKYPALALGACDRRDQESASPADLVLYWNGSHFEITPKSPLPPRPVNPTWGTVAWNTYDQNSRSHLIRITHDFGFKTAQIELLRQYANGTFKSHNLSFTLPAEIEGFIPWAFTSNRMIFFPLSTSLPKHSRYAPLFEKNYLYEIKEDSSIVDKTACIPAVLRKKDGMILTFENSVYYMDQNQVGQFGESFD